MINKQSKASVAIQAAGGIEKVAKEFGLSKPAIAAWCNYGRKVPIKHVIKLCQLTGGLFQPHDIRPEDFDEDQRVEVTV